MRRIARFALALCNVGPLWHNLSTVVRRTVFRSAQVIATQIVVCGKSRIIWFSSPKSNFLNQKSSHVNILLKFYISGKNEKNTFYESFWKNLEYRIFPASSAQLWQNADSGLVLCTDMPVGSHSGAVVRHTVFVMRRNCVTMLPQSITWADCYSQPCVQHKHCLAIFVFPTVEEHTNKIFQNDSGVQKSAMRSALI